MGARRSDEGERQDGVPPQSLWAAQSRIEAALAAVRNALTPLNVDWMLIDPTVHPIFDDEALAALGFATPTAAVDALSMLTLGWHAIRDDVDVRSAVIEFNTYLAAKICRIEMEGNASGEDSRRQA